MVLLQLNCFKKVGPKSRVSKSGKHSDTRLSKIFHNLRKILAFERKTEKVIFTSFNLILLILTHFFCVLWPFRYIFKRFFWLEIFLRNENHF